MEQTKAQFRIGGVYRNGIGDGPWQLGPITVAGRAKLHHAGGGSDLHSEWRLSDGRWLRGSTLSPAPVGHPMNLIPGELHCVNGEWVPLGTPIQPEKPAQPTKTLSELWRELCSERAARAAPPATEAPRPALAYFTEQQERARWNPFADFTVTSGTQEQPPQPQGWATRCADLEPRGLMVR